MKVKVVTVAQMQALEDASEKIGISKDTLMENAGLACAQQVRRHMGGTAGRKALLLIGPGNNGADGLVIARHLRRWGVEVCCYVVLGRPDQDLKMADALPYEVAVLHAADDEDLSKLSELLASCHVVVDAILGAGRYRRLEGVVSDVAALVNRHRRHRADLHVVAVDLPTGVNPDTGAADENTLVADLTLALCYPKFGIANFPGAAYAGRIVVLGIGLPTGALDGIDLPVEWMSDSAAADSLPGRPLDSHKGTYGHLLIVAGSRNFVGASVLAAMAAHRVGAGLVTLATPESVYPIVASKLTETIHLPLREDADGRVDVTAAEVIKERLGGYSALAVGCGLGLSPGTVAFMERLLLAGQDLTMPPVVIDADGLNNLGRCEAWPARLHTSAVLTPHPGEMARLTSQHTAEVQADRLAIVGSSAAEWRQTVLLKGAYSIVASPDGRQCILPFANPALSAGGTGDVLTGIIGGLMAQGLVPYAAAVLGGYLHGTAGEVVGNSIGRAGVVASDLLLHVPQIIDQLRG